jgi:outer membrane protein assembly factor BamB
VNFPRVLAVGLLAGAFLLTAAACGGVKNPEGWASPIEQDSTLFFFPDSDRVTAVRIDGGTAAQVWTFPAADRDDHERLGFDHVYDAAVEGGILYFGSWEGRVLALDAETGEAVWSLKDEIEGGVVGGPTVAEGVVVFGTTEGRIYVRNADDGRAAAGWPNGGIDLPEDIYATPIVSGGRVFVATMDGEVHAYDLATAAEAWAEPFDVSGAVAALSLIDEDRLFVPSFNKKVYVISTETGEAIGEPFLAEDWIWSEPALADETLYFGDFSGRVYALDINTMRLAEGWVAPYESGDRIKSTPVIAGGVLIVANRDPEVHFIDPANGQPLNVVPIDGAGTVRAGLLARENTAIVATTEGKLFVADPDRLQVVPLAITGGQQ